jgi:hypothetical protein
MNLKKYRSIFEIIAVTIIGYSLHKTFFYFNKSNPDFQNFHTPIETIYGFFFICSITILLILIRVKEKNIESLGYAFLFLTCLKMGISYTILAPILHSGNPNIRIEKINFFIIFALFLATETVVTIRILNNKQ